MSELMHEMQAVILQNRIYQKHHQNSSSNNVVQFKVPRQVGAPHRQGIFSSSMGNFYGN
jgi:hypothetical protein